MPKALALKLTAGVSAASEARFESSLRTKGRVRAITPPNIDPQKRDGRVHEEARFGGENSAGEPCRALEANVQETSDVESRSIRCSDDEELHVIERDVKADGEPLISKLKETRVMTSQMF